MKTSSTSSQKLSGACLLMITTLGRWASKCKSRLAPTWLIWCATRSNTRSTTTSSCFWGRVSSRRLAKGKVRLKAPKTLKMSVTLTLTRALWSSSFRIWTKSTIWICSWTDLYPWSIHRPSGRISTLEGTFCVRQKWQKLTLASERLSFIWIEPISSPCAKL